MTDPMAEWQAQQAQQAQSSPDPFTNASPRSRASGPLAVLVLVSGVVGVLVIVGMGVYLLSVWAGDPASTVGASADPAKGGSDQPAYAGPLVAAPGFESMRKALLKETGSTQVIDLTIYPKYAVAEVLEGSAPGRTRSLYYDGKFTQNSLGTTTDRPFDIARLDADKLARLSHQARGLVDDADQWYVVVRAPDDEGAVMWAYASNAFGEGGYLAARVDGTVVRKTTW